MVEKEFLVEKQHAASHVGSGDLEVLSTPAMIAFMENVAKELVKENLKPGETTVGIDLNVQHLKATALGKTVRIRASLTDHNKSILFYELEAFEGERLIGRGTHKRAIVEATTFMENL